MGKEITSRAQDYSQWYNDLIIKGNLADYSAVRGCMVIKPYGYAIFNLDAMTTLCQILSTPKDNLWTYETTDGKSIKKGLEFLYPYIADKSKWTLKPDVMYWENWPVAQPFLLFGANQFGKQAWFNTWKSLDLKPTNAEVIRNLPIRHPLIWL